jgi:hypothetical protein
VGSTRYPKGSLEFYFEYSKGRELRAQADGWGAPTDSVIIARPPRRSPSAVGL